MQSFVLLLRGCGFPNFQLGTNTMLLGVNKWIAVDWRGKCSDRFRIFQKLYKYLIYVENFIEPNLAKVGVEGSNPFARSNISML